MTRTRTPLLKDPAELRPHPLKKTQPKAAEWQKGGEAFNALVDDIRDRGIDHALLITPDGFILDGELCWLAAKQLRLSEVPVVVTDADAAGVILGSLTQRQHLTKSALAYLAFPLMKPAFEAAHKRHLAALRQGDSPAFSRSTQNVLRAQTIEELAERIGISRALLFHAQKLHETFAKHPELRSQFEPAILNGDSALGATLAGIAGQLSTKGKAKNTHAQLELFEAGLGTLKTRFTYWQRFGDDERDKAREVIRETVAEMPADLREEFAAAINAARKTERKAA